jgi:hypothetical protein
MTDSHSPAQEEEPQSPGWLPALGLALFAAVAIAWSLCSGPAAGAAGGQGEPGAAPPAASAAH